MKIAVIGSGGREHAICLSLLKSPKVEKIYALPGNGGIAEIAECVNISAMEFDKIINFAKTNEIDTVFVAPDDPLAGGLVDLLEKQGIRAYGPKAEGAMLEGSKSFSKAFMKRNNIPTGDYEKFDNFQSAVEYVQKTAHPLVVKADGLALGKGVIICQNVEESIEALRGIMVDKTFGDSGKTVIVEEFLTGREVTVLCFTDGKTIIPMPASQDHKRAYDNDEGTNTGGMGAFAPTPYYTAEIEKESLEKIIIPTMEALQKEGISFKGVLYFGLMMTPNGVKVIEYNARFGDPETEVVLPLLKTPLIDIVESTIDEKLGELVVEWDNRTALTVIIASGGYPQNVVKGFEILIGDLQNGVTLYHAGTKSIGGKLVTNGGRVFALTAVANDILEARNIAYGEVDKVTFEGARYRKDIGVK